MPRRCVRRPSTSRRTHRPGKETPRLTQLSTTLVGKDHRDVTDLIERLRPRNQDPAKYAASVNAGTVADQIGRFRELAEAGAAEVMLSLPDLDDDLTPLDTMAEVIAAFR